MGELLKQTVVPKGNHSPGKSGASPSLPDGITKKQSSVAQKLASIPAKQLAKYIAHFQPDLEVIAVVAFTSNMRRMRSQRTAVERV